MIAAINSEGGAPHAPLAPLNALVLALRGEGGHLSQEADVRTVAMVEALPQLRLRARGAVAHLRERASASSPTHARGAVTHVALLAPEV